MPKIPSQIVASWLRGLLLAVALAGGAGTSLAQPPAGVSDVQPGEQIIQVTPSTGRVTLIYPGSRVLELASRIKVVDGFDQDKVTIKALSPRRVRLHAENPGVTTVKLTDEFENVYSVEVFVEPDTRELKAYLERLFPDSAIEVVGIRDGVVLRGWVTEPDDIPEIMAVAEQFYEIVHPQLTVAGPSQVQLHVKVMEVQRSKLRELGVNFLMTGKQYYVQNGIGGIETLASIAQGTTGFLPFGGPPSPAVATAALPNSEINWAITGSSNIFQGFVHALVSESLAKILADPVLVTTSGRPATLHSGGEFPVLVPQSFGNLSIQWREFGVRLEAVPIVLGNGRLRLDLAPEVSERDFSNSVTVNGLVVPGITSRSVNTQVEMRFGETLMIGGLVSSRKQGTTQKIPFLGELPWIGVAFSKKSYNIGETELVILVTPQMVAPMAAHQVPVGGPGLGSATPVDRELYLDGNLEVPSYGPECPTCEPVPEGLLPAGSPPIPTPALPMAPPVLPGPTGPVPQEAPVVPTPATPPIPQLNSFKQPIRTGIQQTKAEIPAERGTRMTIPNPFKAPLPTPAKSKPEAESAPAATARSETRTNTVEANRSEGKPRDRGVDGSSLPGMILPGSAPSGAPGNQ
jgi:pilus assembly protein CpaC